MIYKYSIYLEMFIWLLPPFRQYKGGLFLYFLFIAITPLSAAIALYYFKLYPVSMYAISAASMIIAVQYHKDKKMLTGLIIMIILAPLIFYLNHAELDIWVNIILRCIVISYFFYFLLEYMYNKKAINFYFIILIVFEISTVLKMLTVLINVHTGVLYYHLTTIFELLICPYFIIYNIETSPRLKL
jgi:hypothetical protein